MALLNEGEARVWKEQFIENAMDTSGRTGMLITFGTYTDFIWDLKAAFLLHNQAPNTLAQL